MNLNNYTSALVSLEKQIAQGKQVLKQKEDKAKEIRKHLLKHLGDEGIKTIDTPKARLQVRSRKVNYVEEPEVEDFIVNNPEPYSDYVTEIWPPTFNKTAALKFAQENGVDGLIKSHTSQSLVVTVTGDE